MSGGMKKFNLNDKVYFELTEKGKLRFSDPYFKASVHEAKNGLYETQLWVFCNLFGESLQMGFAHEVKTGIYFEEKDLKEVA
jgi:hypothetical protein